MSCRHYVLYYNGDVLCSPLYSSLLYNNGIGLPYDNNMPGIKLHILSSLLSFDIKRAAVKSPLLHCTL